MAEQQQEIYRAIGKLEAVATAVVTAVESLTKGQLETKLQGERIEQKLNSMTGDVSDTAATAKRAEDKANKAHGRLDRLKWLSAGAAMVGTAVGTLVSWLTNAWQYLPAMVHHP